MTRPSLNGLALHLLLLTLSSGLSWGHDLMASHVLLRFHAKEIELQVKIAADSAWPLVQEINPGVTFSAEEFETTGRPLLLKFAETLDQLTLDGTALNPLRKNVVVAEDTFLFSFVYSRPAGGTLQLTETYLKKMAVDYTSIIRVFDQTGRVISSTTLTPVNSVYQLALPTPEASPPPLRPGPRSSTDQPAQR